MRIPGLGGWREDPLWSYVYPWLVEHPAVGRPAWQAGTGSDLRLIDEAAAELRTLRAGARVLDVPTGSGVALRGVATSAIDVSDGLLGDLGHILRRSQVGATIEADAVPRGAVLAAQPQSLQRVYTLSGGDDYELVFTAPPGRAAQVQAAGAACDVRVTRIGRIEAEPGLRLVDAAGTALTDRFPSFDHFA